MSNIDQFESLFLSATRDIYQYQKINFKNVLLVTDLNRSECDVFSEQVKEFSRLANIKDNGEWNTLIKDDFSSTHDLLEIVERIKPDLIFTYRNLHSQAWKHPHSLGEHLDVLIQKTAAPVFILPHPAADYALNHAMKDCNIIMALTDQLSNDHTLVNHAVSFTEKNGSLYLMHIEDADVFDKYIQAISKIQSIDTSNARKKIADELLKQPTTYINTVKNRLEQENLSINIKTIVDFGHRLSEFTKYINEYKVDLLVMHAKDNQQMAMHGLAYPLAIELRQIPLLML